MLLWEPFSRKRSHWWHWKEWDEKNYPILHGILIPGDPEALPIPDGYQMFMQTNFRWKNVAILKPERVCDTNTEYRIGFKGGGVCQICALVRKGKTAVLIGNTDTSFFAFTKNGQEIPLKMIRVERKEETKVFII